MENGGDNCSESSEIFFFSTCVTTTSLCPDGCYLYCVCFVPPGCISGAAPAPLRTDGVPAKLAPRHTPPGSLPRRPLVCKGNRPRCGGGVRGFVRGWTSVADGAGLEATTRTAHRRQGARVRRPAPRPLLPPPLPPPPPLVLLPTPQRRRVRWLPRVGRQDAVGLHQGPPQLHHPPRKRLRGRLGPRPPAVRGRGTSEGRRPRQVSLTQSLLLPRGPALPVLLLRGHQVAARAPPQGRRVAPPRYCQGRPAPPRRLLDQSVASTRPLLVRRALRGQPPRPTTYRPVLRQVLPGSRPPLAAERPLATVPLLRFARAASLQRPRQPRPGLSRGGPRAPLAEAP